MSVPDAWLPSIFLSSPFHLRHRGQEGMHGLTLLSAPFAPLNAGDSSTSTLQPAVRAVTKTSLLNWCDDSCATFVNEQSDKLDWSTLYVLVWGMLWEERNERTFIDVTCSSSTPNFFAEESRLWISGAEQADAVDRPTPTLSACYQM